MAQDDFLDTNLEVTVATDRESLLKKASATGEAILIVLTGARLGHRAVLGDGMFVIGRAPSAELQLEADDISRVHARVIREGSFYHLVDAGSTNGSYVNYTKVSTRRLVDGDEIQLGHVLLKFLSGDNIETAYHEEFRRLVRHDALTGALNRATFDEELRTALLQRKLADTALSLILFDLDHFKQVNDTWGHTAGDRVLRAMGEVVLALAEAPQIFARVGGEEFAVIFFGAPSAALRFGERLRSSIAALDVVYEDETIKVKTSVGIATPEGNPTAAELYQEADRLLYAAKQGGRDRLRHGVLKFPRTDVDALPSRKDLPLVAGAGREGDGGSEVDVGSEDGTERLPFPSTPSTSSPSTPSPGLVEVKTLPVAGARASASNAQPEREDSPGPESGAAAPEDTGDGALQGTAEESAAALKREEPAAR